MSPRNLEVLRTIRDLIIQSISITEIFYAKLIKHKILTDEQKEECEVSSELALTILVHFNPFILS